MADEAKVIVGSTVTLRDGAEEWKIIYEGTVTALKTISGTTKTRVVCDPPLWMDWDNLD